MAYPLGKIIVPALHRPWIRKIEGKENIPMKGPFIIAANHSSYFDVFLLPSVIVPKINRRIHAWVNAYYYGNLINRFFLNMWGGIPVYVEKEQNSKNMNRKTFMQTIKYLKNNEPVMIFPEGRRNDGKLGKAYPGIARLALAAKAPVLPIGIIGANKVLPKGKTIPRLARCEIKIGKPLNFDKYYGKKTGKTYEQVTKIIMKEIAKLINQKYAY